MYLYNIGYTGNIYKQKMSVILSFILLYMKLAISFFRIKAKNAFYYSPTISPVRLYKYTFFVQYYALIKSIISFKYKDFSSFMDGNNRIFVSQFIGSNIIFQIISSKNVTDNQLYKIFIIPVKIPLKIMI